MERQKSYSQEEIRMWRKSEGEGKIWRNKKKKDINPKKQENY